MRAPDWLIDGARRGVPCYRELYDGMVAEAEQEFLRLGALPDASPLDVQEAGIRVQELKADLRGA